MAAIVALCDGFSAGMRAPGGSPRTYSGVMLSRRMVQVEGNIDGAIPNEK
jgi:hypothetical protein